MPQRHDATKKRLNSAIQRPNISGMVSQDRYGRKSNAAPLDNSRLSPCPTLQPVQRSMKGTEMQTTKGQRILLSTLASVAPTGTAKRLGSAVSSTCGRGGARTGNYGGPSQYTMADSSHGQGGTTGSNGVLRITSNPYRM